MIRLFKLNNQNKVVFKKCLLFKIIKIINGITYWYHIILQDFAYYDISLIRDPIGLHFI